MRYPTRLDAVPKVTGKARYAVDFAAHGMLFSALVRSERGHAILGGVDAEAALSVKGVVAVITGEDLAPLFPRYGHIVADHPILAIGKVRYLGEPVALVVAEDRYSAHDGAEAVEVLYQDLPTVMNPDQALADGAPLLHTTDYGVGDRSFSEAHSEPRSDNVCHRVDLHWGDVEQAMSRADHVVETSTSYPMLYGYAMEPYNALAHFEDGYLKVITTAQHPFMVRDDLARVFSLPLSHVRVTSPYVGGGYGTKSYTKVEPLAAVGAWYTGRPVKVEFDATGSILTTRADSARVTIRSGFSSDGRLLARDVDLILDTGAYADNGPLVLSKASNRSFGPYRNPNVRVRGRAVYTNTVPSSSYRGFGAPQVSLASELNMDQAAEVLRIDPGELRRRNLIPPGERHYPGKRPMDADLAADLDLLLEGLGWGKPTPERHGIGFGVTASDAGAFPVSTATVKILPDGSALLSTGSSEMGQGSRTALSLIASRELGIPLERVAISQSDTHATPYERTSGASRTTTLVGLAIQRACLQLLARLEEVAVELKGGPPTEVKAAEGTVVGPWGDLSYGEVVQEWFGGQLGELSATGVVRRAGDLAELPPFWEIGASGVKVRVDPDTGQVFPLRMVTVADVGHAIHPEMLKGQDVGAATQGLGAALFEELVYDGPQLVNPNLVEYRVPRAKDMPGEIVSIVAERGDGVGPYGAKGGGEGTLNPMGAATAAAVARAVGRWPDRLPLTPERVWRLMRESGR
ncbi:MAG: xanthine dehydrogenase family protein molybdopterin-binding subunit [bacterium]|nr:xanthine dehydrogenase family protein molybdopterin-binding subunit [bacterium]MDE0600904.1 xanthine dehydrogenase family protein molybdopterin-binding subunit [bacterium]